MRRKLELEEPLRMAAVRVNAGLTQDEVAKALGVTKQTIVNWEKGATQPKIDQARALSRLYNMDLDIFFYPDNQI